MAGERACGAVRAGGDVGAGQPGGAQERGAQAVPALTHL